GGGGRALAPRPGVVPGAPEDAPQRPLAAAPRRAGDGRCRAREARARPGPPATDGSGRGVAEAARGVRGDRARSARPARRRGGRVTEDPGRRLTPVLRLGPAQPNLTLGIARRRAA